MAKSDTVHKCEVMDFFTCDPQKHTNIRMYAQTNKFGSDINLQFSFPDITFICSMCLPPENALKNA